MKFSTKQTYFPIQYKYRNRWPTGRLAVWKVSLRNRWESGGPNRLRSARFCRLRFLQRVQGPAWTIFSVVFFNPHIPFIVICIIEANVLKSFWNHVFCLVSMQNVCCSRCSDKNLEITLHRSSGDRCCKVTIVPLRRLFWGTQECFTILGITEAIRKSTKACFNFFKLFPVYFGSDAFKSILDLKYKKKAGSTLFHCFTTFIIEALKKLLKIKAFLLQRETWKKKTKN